MASTRSLILFIFSIVSISAAYATHHAAAPAPSFDCSILVMKMAECLTYVSNGSTTTKPEGSCCSGLKTVLNTDAECLCEAFKSSAQFGVVLNVTKAIALPTACKLQASSVPNCGCASPSSSASPSPTTASGSNVQAPAPSPGASNSHGLSMSVGSLAIGFVIAVFSCF
ncbi:non-specific lipid transfer protein GPI-anchored 31 isoform X2 [Manihot esculenta]|uniref:Bifunctional inhibitor/plant lipid transfer protein/seed storage helical domain-containing protein n=1 Tax=Manihot esculenta TaxID=3983 RepID=A0A2C9UM06_MANES|nr:non-specific lipid transfer protein GPI-anchored 31 isoform X2 [Manihot esculenta]OAY32109.1 hypothetical protein MANES_14G166800v8 [Manihot esculenta]